MEIWFGNLLKIWVLPISRPTDHEHKSESVSQLKYKHQLHSSPKEAGTRDHQSKRDLNQRTCTWWDIHETDKFGRKDCKYPVPLPFQSPVWPSLGVESSFSTERKESKELN